MLIILSLSEFCALLRIYLFFITVSEIVITDAMTRSTIPTMVFQYTVSCRIMTANTGAIAGLTKNVIEPVEASEYLIARK